MDRNHKEEVVNVVWLALGFTFAFILLVAVIGYLLANIENYHYLCFYG